MTTSAPDRDDSDSLPEPVVEQPWPGDSEVCALFAANQVNIPHPLTQCAQPHGIGVCCLRNSQPLPDSSAFPEQADALASDGVDVLCIRTADCVPILLHDPERHVVAAVHSGWRGTRANIVNAALRQLADNYGTRSEDLRAAIGPHIGVESYTVGPEFDEFFGGRTGYYKRGGARHLDLGEAVASQLLEGGIPLENIRCSTTDTYADPRWPSYRRDKTKQRINAIIFLREKFDFQVPLNGKIL